MKTIRHLTVVMLLLAQAACAVQQTVALAPQDAAQQVRAGQAFERGERIVIALHNGKRYAGTFVEFTATELVTQRARYALADVATISYEQTNREMSVLKSVGIGAAIVTVVMVAAAVAFGKALGDSLDKQGKGQ